MNKELQDLAWSILPKEFKEEVKRNFQLTDADCIAYEILIDLFGIHNLTSDAQGEEILTVSRKNVQRMYSYNEEEITKDPTNKGALLLKLRLDALFGPKCLLDGNEDNFASKEQEHDYTPNGCTHPNKENCRWKDKSLDCNLKNGCYYEPKPAEPKLKVGDKVRVLADSALKDMVGEIGHIDDDTAESYCVCVYDNDGELKAAGRFGYDGLEPYAEPSATLTNDCQSQCKNQSRNLSQDSANCNKDHIGVDNEMVDKIVKDGFRDHNRLHIAAILAAGMLASEVRCYPIDRALELADKLIAECKKGGGNA